MGVEIERRFLVDVSKLPSLGDLPVEALHQGYLSKDPVVRVRLIKGNTGRDEHHCSGCTTAKLTIKGKGTLSRPEFEYSIPVTDAEELLCLAKLGIIYKNRYTLGRWSIDQFTDDDLDGLWLAEIELGSEHELLPYPKPEWLGEEVTEDVRYTNAHLAEHGKP